MKSDETTSKQGAGSTPRGRKLRSTISLLFLGGLLTAAAIWWWNQGPFYKRKSLDTWLRILNFNDPSQTPAAQEALRSLGQKAWPRMVWLLRATDNEVPAQYRYATYVQTLLGQRADDIAASDLHQWAGAGFKFFGSNAVPSVVPLLSDELEVGRVSAAQLLAEMGPQAWPAVPALRQVLKQPEPLRTPTLFALAQIGPGAREAVPDLVALLKELRESAKGNDTAMVLAVIDKLDPAVKTNDSIVKEVWDELETQGKLLSIMDATTAVRRRGR